jgi:hypothetical protein
MHTQEPLLVSVLDRLRREQLVTASHVFKLRFDLSGSEYTTVPYLSVTGNDCRFAAIEIEFSKQFPNLLYFFGELIPDQPVMRQLGLALGECRLARHTM